MTETTIDRVVHKRVGNVTAVPLDSRTTAAYVIGNTVLEVDNSGDHEEDGGTVLIAGVPHAYTTCEEGEDDDAPPPSITLAAPGLTVNIPADTAIEEYDPATETVVVDYMVEVTDDGDASPATAYLHHTLIPLLPEGTPPGVGDSVEVYIDRFGDWTVTNILGRPATIDVEHVPGAATTEDLLTSANGKNAIHWSTEPPPDPPADTSIDGDLWWQRGVDDEGDPTDALVGLWRFDGTAWQSQQLGSETIAYLDAGAITSGNLTAITVETRSENERGVKLGYVEGAEGLFVYDDDGVVFLKAVPAEGMAVVAGEVKANTLTVASDDPDSPPGTSLGGTTEIATGGRILLTGGTTAPKSAPTVTYGYDTIQFTNDGEWGNRYGWATDGTHWYTARDDSGDLILEKWTTAGTLASAVTHAGDIAGATLHGVVVHSGSLYLLAVAPGFALVGKYSASTLAAVDTSEWTHIDGTKDPALGVDPATGDLLIAQSRASDTNKVRIRRYTFNAGGVLTAGASVDTTTTYDANLVGVLYGSADFGANRYVVASPAASQSFRPITTGGVFQTAEYWDTGMTIDKVGFAHDGTNFVCMDRNGQMRTYTGIWSTTSSDMTKWVSNTLVQGSGPTYQTDQSPRAKIVMAKRSKLNVTTSPIPDSSDADRVRIYVGQGTTSPPRTSMALQTAPAVGVITKSYTSLTAPPGTNPPAANDFPDADGSSLDGPGGVFIQHDGTIPDSPYRDSFDARVTELDRRTINVQLGTSYTLALTDERAVVDVSNAGTHTLTVPANSTVAFPIGTEIEVFRRGTGAVNIAAAGGVSIESRSGLLGINGRYGVVRLRKRNTDIWVLSGDLA